MVNIATDSKKKGDKCCFCGTITGALVKLHQGWCCVPCMKELMIKTRERPGILTPVKEAGEGTPSHTRDARAPVTTQDGGSNPSPGIALTAEEQIRRIHDILNSKPWVELISEAMASDTLVDISRVVQWPPHPSISESPPPGIAPTEEDVKRRIHGILDSACTRIKELEEQLKDSEYHREVWKQRSEMLDKRVAQRNEMLKADASWKDQWETLKAQNTTQAEIIKDLEAKLKESEDWLMKFKQAHGVLNQQGTEQWHELQDVKKQLEKTEAEFQNARIANAEQYSELAKACNRAAYLEQKSQQLEAMRVDDLAEVNYRTGTEINELKRQLAEKTSIAPVKSESLRNNALRERVADLEGLYKVQTERSARLMMECDKADKRVADLNSNVAAKDRYILELEAACENCTFEDQLKEARREADEWKKTALAKEEVQKVQDEKLKATTAARNFAESERDRLAARLKQVENDKDHYYADGWKAHDRIGELERKLAAADGHMKNAYRMLAELDDARSSACEYIVELERELKLLRPNHNMTDKDTRHRHHLCPCKAIPEPHCQYCGKINIDEVPNQGSTTPAPPAVPLSRSCETCIAGPVRKDSDAGQVRACFICSGNLSAWRPKSPPAVQGGKAGGGSSPQAREAPALAREAPPPAVTGGDCHPLRSAPMIIVPEAEAKNYVGDIKPGRYWVEANGRPVVGEYVRDGGISDHHWYVMIDGYWQLATVRLILPLTPAEDDYTPGSVQSPPHKDGEPHWKEGCYNCGMSGQYDQHQVWGIINGKVTLRGYSCYRLVPPAPPTTDHVKAVYEKFKHLDHLLSDPGWMAPDTSALRYTTYELWNAVKEHATKKE